MHPCVELSVAERSMFFLCCVAVFLSSESTCCLVCLCSEESFHAPSDDDFASVVVNGCVRKVGVEDDGVVGYHADWKWTVTGVWDNSDRSKALKQELRNME